jgi:hypothetical protein
MTNDGHPKSRAARAAAKLFTVGAAGNPRRPTAPTVNNFG